MMPFRKALRGFFCSDDVIFRFKEEKSGDLLAYVVEKQYFCSAEEMKRGAARFFASLLKAKSKKQKRNEKAKQ